MVTQSEARQIFAGNFLAVLDKRGISQGDVARAIKADDEDLQTARNRVSRYARAVSEVSSADLANIAEYLQVSIDSLLSCRKKNSQKSA